MLADPLLDHGRDGLHGALDIDAPVGIARHLEGLSKFAAKASPAEANHPHAVNRTIEMVREACQQWIGLAPPPEEDHVDTFSVMLVDEHADMAARFKRAGDLEWRRDWVGGKRRSNQVR